ncbi:hypothetical protein P3T76_014723 [Phytophthora citrophthora]|uniref:Uncharacterized protein n=1 Tax=Phytophthora citrophthora TaxID=4793 RepID=A0AAD9G1R2_9STRA|nr:hypothetical protein P3T76_014723 [Phytophthora citrophthora]
MSTATKMVFRFTKEHDKKLMREVIAHKPFEAKYGDAARVWTHVAERVSTAIQTKVVEKQVRDRVRLLKKHWRAGDLRSALGSGIEESRDAVNEQSQYETDDKKERAKKKKADEASATRCASEIEEEAIVRRALRAEDYESTSSVSDSEDIDDVASSSSTPSSL